MIFLIPPATAPRLAARSSTLVLFASAIAASETVLKPSPALIAASPILSNTFATLSRIPEILSLMATTPSLIAVTTLAIASPIALTGSARDVLNSENASTISARFVPTASTISTMVSPICLISPVIDSMIGLTSENRSVNAATMDGRFSTAVFTMSMIAGI